ncbi:phage protein [Vibrio phage pTD1]|uniref:Phage protein n=1 Tax=Vibrio phage pTD1 TaxID=1938577 RepID=A0A1Q2U375_9CAUD|nr:phage protein [Vibrio phage pTD1]BAW98414.1 phage protein [Vibrio phage pTD1]
MENFYLNLLLNSGPVDGQEAFNLNKYLGPIEGFRMRFKSLSLELDKKIAGMSSSIHTIDYAAAQSKANKESYLKRANTPMPIPVHFNPRNTTMEKYIKSCISAVALVDSFKTDSSRFYDWMREIASKGKVSGTFRYTVSSTSRAIDELDKFIKTLGNPKKEMNIPLKDAYSSFNEMFRNINEYNINVKMIKPRDAETIARQLQLNAELGELLLARIASNDVVLNENDLDIIKRVFDDFERYMNLTGALVGMLNELSAVLKAQCDAI